MINKMENEVTTNGLTQMRDERLLNEGRLSELHHHKETESLEYFLGKLKGYKNVSAKIESRMNELAEGDAESHSWYMKFQRLVIECVKEEKP